MQEDPVKRAVDVYAHGRRRACGRCDVLKTWIRHTIGLRAPISNRCGWDPKQSRSHGPAGGACEAAQIFEMRKKWSQNDVDVVEVPYQLCTRDPAEERQPDLRVRPKDVRGHSRLEAPIKKTTINRSTDQRTANLGAESPHVAQRGMGRHGAERMGNQK